MTPHEKAGQTIHERSEKRKAALREELERLELIKRTMTEVLSDSSASSSYKVLAGKILLELSKMR